MYQLELTHNELFALYYLLKELDRFSLSGCGNIFELIEGTCGNDNFYFFLDQTSLIELQKVKNKMNHKIESK